MRGHTCSKYEQLSTYETTQDCVAAQNSCFRKVSPPQWQLPCDWIDTSSCIFTSIPPSLQAPLSIPSTLQSSIKRTDNNTTWGNTHAETHIQSTLHIIQSGYNLTCPPYRLQREKQKTITSSWLNTVLLLFPVFIVIVS